MDLLSGCTSNTDKLSTGQVRRTKLPSVLWSCEVVMQGREGASERGRGEHTASRGPHGTL